MARRREGRPSTALSLVLAMGLALGGAWLATQIFSVLGLDVATTTVSTAMASPLLPPPTDASPGPSTTVPRLMVFSTEAEQYLASVLNDRRAFLGLASLSTHPDLNAYARAMTMAKSQRVNHSQIEELLGSWSTVGEVVETASEIAVLGQQVESRQHHAVLTPGFTHAGVGVVVDANEILWICEVVGAANPTTPLTERGGAPPEMPERNARNLGSGYLPRPLLAGLGQPILF